MTAYILFRCTMFGEYDLTSVNSVYSDQSKANEEMKKEEERNTDKRVTFYVDDFEVE